MQRRRLVQQRSILLLMLMVTFITPCCLPRWTELVMRKVLGKAPPGRMRFANGGVRATNSAFMASCYRMFAPADTDIFFVVRIGLESNTLLNI